MRLPQFIVNVCVTFGLLSLAIVVFTCKRNLIQPLSILDNIVTVEATTEDQYTEYRKKNSGVVDHYSVRYNFPVDGVMIPGQTTTKTVPTKLMQIQYYKNDPFISHQDLRGEAQGNLLVYGVAGVVLLFSSTLLFVHVRHVLKHR